MRHTHGARLAHPEAMHLSALLLCGVAVLGINCGGRIASQELPVQTIAFHPAIGTAGYGFAGAFSIKLADTASDGATRTATISLGRTKTSWETAIDGTRSQVELVQVQAGTTLTFHAVSGTVTHTQSAARIQAPGSPFGSLGSVSGHIDVVLVDTADPSHEVHLSGDYVASLTVIG
jgi:hypothetical protein